MTTAEIALLAVAVGLGAAAGAALTLAVRVRFPSSREVRLTITPNAIPAGRPRTLAGLLDGDHPGAMSTWPDAGEPPSTSLGVVREQPAAAAAQGGGDLPARTRVPVAPVNLPATVVGVPVAGGAVGVGVLGSAVGMAVRESPSVASTAASTAASPGRTARPPRDDSLAALGMSRPAGVTLRRPVATVARAETPSAGQPQGQADPDAPVPASDAPAAVPGTPVPAPGAPASGPCDTPRRVVEEKCALAETARGKAAVAAQVLRDAQREYDVLRERVDSAQAVADPRRVAAEKDRLHSLFRAATERGGGPEDTEAAARAWLDEINALNAAVRDARRVTDQGGAELRGAHPALERLSAEADAARIAAENAEVGCRDARQELAACEEAEALARQVPPPPEEEPHPFARVWPADDPNLPEPPREPTPGEVLAGSPVVTRVLRGDRDARERLIASLAADEPDAGREWTLRVSRLVDAIVGRAIEDGYLDLPTDHSFWRLFEPREVRDIVGALSALGFRYDGLGGFADGRVPAARDLSLAVGYAGLDRMRIRTWPNEAEIATLYEGVVVAADEWLADQADDLSLGRMVDALGGRAAELADIWNAWGRVRPALLAN